jgi:2-phosphosulfolactate phosphatase
LDIHRYYLPDAHQAQGIVIVIDVIRAFTVAAYAFAGGASRLWLVRTTEEAFALREREPGALLAGEIGGRLIPGFDLNNSPSLMAASDVRGRLIIQRTGAGTQGAVRAQHASHLLICSLVNARATARYARELAMATQQPITLLPTEEGLPEALKSRAGEDTICADYLEALLREEEKASVLLAENLARLEARGRFHFLTSGDSDFPIEDVYLIKDLNRFDFVMIGKHQQWENVTYVEVERQSFP